MKEVNMKSNVIASLFWKLMERGGTQGIQFIVQIVLARLLLPKDYGVISLITVFIAIANVFIQNGFTMALIQKKDVNEVDFSSVFYLNLIVACFAYAILFFIAPFIANFYGAVQITPVIRVLSFTLFFGAVNSVQNAVISRTFQFKKLFFSSLGAIVMSGIIGVVLAYLGYGVWALVAQQIVNQLTITIILWFTVNWRPRLIFSYYRVKILFSYGWKLLLSSLIDVLYMNLSNLFIGKIYNAETLGFYQRGQQFPSLIATNINGSIQSVMLPLLSSHQDNKPRVKSLMRRSIVTSSFILFPLMIGLAVTAEPIVKILLTEKWLPSVPFMQIYCLIFALWPIHTANLQAINALGRSDIFLRLEVIKKVVGLIILSITVFHGVYAIALGGLVSGLFSSIINSYPNTKLLGYSYKEQWDDIMPSLITSILMGVVVYSINYIKMEDWVILVIQILVGATLYIGLSLIFKNESFIYLLKTIKEFSNKKGKI